MSLDFLNTYNNNGSSRTSSTGSSSDNEMTPKTADPISYLFHNVVGTFFPSASQSSSSSSSSSSAMTDSTESGEEAPTGVDTDSLETYHSDGEQEINNRNRRRRGVKRKHSETAGARKRQKSEQVSQYKINCICSCLATLGIRNREDLLGNFKKLIYKINKNPKIFKSSYTEEKCFEIFKQALTVYNRINYCTIEFYDRDVGKHHFKTEDRLAPVPETDDLTRITHNYDRLVKSHETKKSIHEGISEILKNQPYAVCSHVIFGAGDTGTTMWLEKYSTQHGKTEQQLTKGQFPEVLIIGEDSGSWKHNYTLAQPHNLLERENSKYNPNDFITESTYQENPQTNGRHLYQANQIILAKTQAPILYASVLKIEKRSKHFPFFNSSYAYRLEIKTSVGKKYIYTNEIDICTGLGPARNALIGTIIDQKEYARLHQFDENKQFTPIVDGNQFVLSNSEEKCTKPRTIVIYGGGGTAAACYRKGFFGHDNKVSSLEFTEENKKNSLLWIARNFDKAGGGKLATTAIRSAQNRNEIISAELKKISHDELTGKLKLHFEEKDLVTNGIKLLEVECDQLIYSTGQDDYETRRVLQELEEEIELDFDDTRMPLGVRTKDDKVHYHGAAAMAVREKEYMTATWDWLKRENIGPDVGPGSMPPSRAQIKGYMAKRGTPVQSVNVNTDSSDLIKSYLLQIGLDQITAAGFVSEILQLRKHSTSGFSKQTLIELLNKYHLNTVFEIYGHGQLSAKTTTINLNSDTRNVMEKFLEKAGVGILTTHQFLEDVIEARKKVGFDLNPTVLQKLLDKHSINGFVQINGRDHLTKR